jgi:hypothetical protein
MRFALLLPLSLATVLSTIATPASAQISNSSVKTASFSSHLQPGGASYGEDFSSSVGNLNGLDGVVTSARSDGAVGGIQVKHTEPLNRPFRSLSLTVNVGTSGIGFDVATPIAPRLKVRVGAQFYNQDFGFTTNGLNTEASLHLRDVALMLDVFPFHNGFHLSPGVTLNNDNYLAGAVNVPGGQTFTLGDTTFTSSVTDPVGGAVSILLGNKVAPRFTLGWEDVLRHKAGHFSLPVEFGFQYSHAPVVNLTLTGTACSQDGCSKASSPQLSDAAQQEVVKLQSDLQPLRFYPITSIGVRYTFGR